MSEVTDKHGRITYNLPPEHSVGYGLYPVRMVVRGDHSCLHMTLACLPPKTETVRQTGFKNAIFSNLLNFKFAVLCQCRLQKNWYYVTKIVLTYCEKKKCFSDREKLLKFEILRSLEHFIQTVKGQNNFW